MSDATTPHVAIEDYVRAESDFQFREYVGKFDCFGHLVHSRAPYDVHDQVTVRGNRDTLYSFGVFDLASPLTVRLPDPGNRYQSLMTVSQDHSIEVSYGPAEVALTVETVGTRYVCLVVRTFADPTDETDLRAAHALQDQVAVQQADRVCSTCHSGTSTRSRTCAPRSPWSGRWRRTRPRCSAARTSSTRCIGRWVLP